MPYTAQEGQHMLNMIASGNYTMTERDGSEWKEDPYTGRRRCVRESPLAQNVKRIWQELQLDPEDPSSIKYSKKLQKAHWILTQRTGYSLSEKNVKKIQALVDEIKNTPL